MRTACRAASECFCSSFSQGIFYFQVYWSSDLLGRPGFGRALGGVCARRACAVGLTRRGRYGIVVAGGFGHDRVIGIAVEMMIARDDAL
jgi:hypothetical protein